MIFYWSVNTLRKFRYILGILLSINTIRKGMENENKLKSAVLSNLANHKR